MVLALSWQHSPNEFAIFRIVTIEIDFRCYNQDGAETSYAQLPRPRLQMPDHLSLINRFA
jgi:hypothetical protein